MIAIVINNNLLFFIINSIELDRGIGADVFLPTKILLNLKRLFNKKEPINLYMLHNRHNQILHSSRACFQMHIVYAEENFDMADTKGLKNRKTIHFHPPVTRRNLRALFDKGARRFNFKV